MKKILVLFILCLQISFANFIDIKLDNNKYYYRDNLTATVTVGDLSEYANLINPKLIVYLLDKRNEKYGQKIFNLTETKISPVHKNRDTANRKFVVIYNLDELNLILGDYSLVAKVNDILADKKPLEIVNYEVEPAILASAANNVAAPAKLKLETDKLSYKTKETITAKLEVFNPSKSSPLKLHFTSGQKYNFVLINKKSGRIVWNWSNNKFFTQNLNSELLKPQQNSSYTEKIDLAGLKLPAGSYILEAKCLGLKQFNVAKTELKITK